MQYHVHQIRKKKVYRKFVTNKNIIMIPHGTDTVVIKQKSFSKDKKKKHYFFSRLHKKKGIEELVESWLNIKNNDWEAPHLWF